MLPLTTAFFFTLSRFFNSTRNRFCPFRFLKFFISINKPLLDLLMALAISERYFVVLVMFSGDAGTAAFCVAFTVIILSRFSVETTCGATSGVRVLIGKKG